MVFRCHDGFAVRMQRIASRPQLQRVSAGKVLPSSEERSLKLSQKEPEHFKIAWLPCRRGKPITKLWQAYVRADTTYALRQASSRVLDHQDASAPALWPDSLPVTWASRLLILHGRFSIRGAISPHEKVTRFLVKSFTMESSSSLLRLRSASSLSASSSWP